MVEYYSPSSCSLPQHVSLLCLSLRINNTVTPYSSAAVLAQHTVTISWLRYSLSLSLSLCSCYDFVHESCVKEKYPVNNWVAHMSVTSSDLMKEEFEILLN